MSTMVRNGAPAPTAPPSWERSVVADEDGAPLAVLTRTATGGPVTATLAAPRLRRLPGGGRAVSITFVLRRLPTPTERLGPLVERAVVALELADARGGPRWLVALMQRRFASELAERSPESAAPWGVLETSRWPRRLIVARRPTGADLERLLVRSSVWTDASYAGSRLLIDGWFVDGNVIDGRRRPTRRAERLSSGESSCEVIPPLQRLCVGRGTGASRPASCRRSCSTAPIRCGCGR